jgi:hypothetical protein
MVGQIAPTPHFLMVPWPPRVRITTTVKLRDGRTAHVRKASRSEPRQKIIHDALRLTANPGGTSQTIV